ncbi:MAG: OB-fold nucleic acid binding domain-containing protein [Candidatus Micrarchaeota archaeon]
MKVGIGFELNRAQLVLLAVVLSLLGLALLVYLARNLEAESVELSAVGEGMIGHYVEVEGVISSASTSNGNVFLSVCRGECVRVVIFKSVAEKMKSPNPYLLKKGDAIVARGTVEEYEMKYEIVVFSARDVGLKG